jgi:hypothetical protein
VSRLPTPPPAYPHPYAVTPPPTHPRAVPSLVLGILSLVLCGFFTGIPAMVLGRRVIRDVGASGGTVGGEGLAQGGFWTGLVGTAWAVLVTLVAVSVFDLGAIASTSVEQTCHTVSSHHPHRDRPC